MAIAQDLSQALTTLLREVLEGPPASGAFVLNTLVERPFESLAGLGFLVLGLPAYWYWRRQSVSVS